MSESRSRYPLMASIVALRAFRGVCLLLELLNPLLILAGGSLIHLREICRSLREDLLAAAETLYLWSQGHKQAPSAVFILARNNYLASTIWQYLARN